MVSNSVMNSKSYYAFVEGKLYVGTFPGPFIYSDPLVNAALVPFNNQVCVNADYLYVNGRYYQITMPFLFNIDLINIMSGQSIPFLQLVLPLSFGFSAIEDAVMAFSTGEFVLVLDDEDRENEGDLIIAGEDITEDKMAFMIRHTR